MEVSEVLPSGHPPLTECYSPAKFDAQRRGAMTRNDKQPVKLVVQEVCTRVCSPCHIHMLALTQVTYSMSFQVWLQIDEVCGDLYPDDDESGRPSSTRSRPTPTCATAHTQATPLTAHRTLVWQKAAGASTASQARSVGSICENGNQQCMHGDRPPSAVYASASPSPA